MKAVGKSRRGSKTTSEQARKAAQARWANTPAEGRSEAASSAANAGYTDQQRASAEARRALAKSKRLVPCLICGKPKGSGKVLCGLRECERLHNNARQNEFQRKTKARTGQRASSKYRGIERFACAGECGRVVRRSADGGASTCRDCCHQSNPRLSAAKRKLAKAARGKRAPKNWAWCSGECVNCGDSFTRKGTPSPYCSGKCRRKSRGKWIGRADRLAIYERDEWTCGLCREPVVRDLNWLDDWAPTLDHITPRSKGGSDDPLNLRLAHRWCNSVRGDDSYYTAADLVA